MKKALLQSVLVIGCLTSVANAYINEGKSIEWLCLFSEHVGVVTADGYRSLKGSRKCPVTVDATELPANYEVLIFANSDADNKAKLVHRIDLHALPTDETVFPLVNEPRKLTRDNGAFSKTGRILRDRSEILKLAKMRLALPQPKGARCRLQTS